MKCEVRRIILDDYPSRARVADLVAFAALAVPLFIVLGSGGYRSNRKVTDQVFTHY